MFVVSVPARRQHYKGLRSIVEPASRRPDGDEGRKTSVSDSWNLQEAQQTSLAQSPEVTGVVWRWFVWRNRLGMVFRSALVGVIDARVHQGRNVVIGEAVIDHAAIATSMHQIAIAK
jgi:hypothetical protein